jgi:hypothetical protein
MLESICETCDNRPVEPSRWHHHIAFLALLQKGGYPFRRNDLSLEEWVCMGEYNDEIDRIEKDVEQELLCRLPVK